MHTVVAIHCWIHRSSAENHGSGAVSERTSGQLPTIRPNSLTLPDETGSMLFLEPQVPHSIGSRCTIQTYLKMATQVHPPQTTSWTHATQPLPLSPAKLVLIDAYAYSAGIVYRTLPLSVQANGTVCTD